MKACYMGIDASKGYADFVIVNQHKKTMVENFQLDDTFEGHSQLFEILNRFFCRTTSGNLICRRGKYRGL